MKNNSKRYFGDSPKAVEIYARKYFPAAEVGETESANDTKTQSFPTAHDLAEYDAVFEGGAELVLKLIEREQNHRHEWENKALRMQNLGRRFGQALFILIVLYLVYATLNLVKSEHLFSAFSLLLIGFGGLAASLFFISKQRFNFEKRHHLTNRYNNKYRGK